MPRTLSFQQFIASALLTGALLFAGCAAPKEGTTSDGISSETVEAARSRWADATPESLEQGRQIYRASCNRCHPYPDIAAYAEKEWPGIMEAMGKKARLSDEHRELVQRYLIATHATLAAK